MLGGFGAKQGDGLKTIVLYTYFVFIYFTVLDVLNDRVTNPCPKGTITNTIGDQYTIQISYHTLPKGHGDKGYKRRTDTWDTDLDTIQILFHTEPGNLEQMHTYGDKGYKRLTDLRYKSGHHLDIISYRTLQFRTKCIPTVTRATGAYWNLRYRSGHHSDILSYRTWQFRTNAYLADCSNMVKPGQAVDALWIQSRDVRKDA